MIHSYRHLMLRKTSKYSIIRLQTTNALKLVMHSHNIQCSRASNTFSQRYLVLFGNNSMSYTSISISYYKHTLLHISFLTMS
ncbi:hypothetical protein ERO13_D11G222042v2 [Gossypium hirsutum]|uniref:Uncharacterized protein n=2 Tax=Gossypium TaxID=3633 RepID=A0A5J5PG38_GOSBA|nr:hypothetical protein ES319_D11G237000v1 [Gossypium barbadense]KAG4121670.1 hypothetical protein ERO13_D11G222042v2 [Gossypium hirsutum]TYI56891.1 hypothetical protein E1A91_D11G243700v1 [Gossypium mustelinum]